MYLKSVKDLKVSNSISVGQITSQFKCLRVKARMLQVTRCAFMLMSSDSYRQKSVKNSPYFFKFLACSRVTL
jgi:hypothetical protein